MQNLEDKNIVLFDGVCNVCNASVQFLIKHDTLGYFSFTSIQSEIGQGLIEKYGLEEVDSIILIENNRADIYSEAIFNIVKNLKSWHRHLYVFHIIPRKLRDAGYRLFAKIRYNIFGKKEQCMVPTADLAKRFL